MKKAPSQSASRFSRRHSRRLVLWKPGMCLATGVVSALVGNLAVTTAFAGDATWTGTTSSDYNVGTNWSTGIVPADPGTATFNNAGNGNTTITNATTTINRIVFDTANAAAYTIGSSANTITLDNASAGGTVSMNATVINNQTISANFLLGNNVITATPLASGAHSFTNATNLGTGRTLTISGNIAGIAAPPATAGAEVLSLNGPGAGILSGNISNGGASTFQVNVNSGIWTLSGANTFAGPTFTQDTVTFTRGVALGNAASFLRIGSNGALGNGVLNITNGSATIQAVNGDQAVNRDFVLGNNGFIVSGANSLTTSGRLVTGGTPLITNNIVSGKVFEIDGNFEIRNNAGARTATFNGSGTTVLGGSVVNNNAALTGFAAVGSVAYTGTGTLRLSGANNYTGTTAVTSGTLTLDYSTTAGTKISGTGTGGALTLGGGTLNLNGGATVEMVASTSLNAGASAINQTGGTSTIVLGALTRNAGSTLALNVGGIANTTTGTANTLLTTTFGVVGVVGGNDWAAKNAANTSIVGLSTTTAGYTPNTPTGFTSGANTDVTSNVTLAAPAATSTLRFNTPGALTVDQNNNTLNLTQGGILVTPAVGANLTTITGGTLTASNSLVVIQNNTSNGLTIASTVGGTSPFIKSGAGLVTLSNATNTYTGVTYLNQGTVNVIADGSLGTAPATATATQLSMNGGTLQFGANNVNLTANRGVTLLGNGGTIDTNGNTGSVAGIIAGAGGLTKAGAGTLTVNPTAGPNTYTGATIVNGGTLSLARAGTNSGTAVTGGTLAATPITINPAGTLLLSATNAMNPTSTVTLSGGTFSVANGVQQGSAIAAGTTGTSVVGAGLLTLTANSSLNFAGTAGTVVFNGYDPTNLNTGNFSLTVSGTNFGTAMSSTDGINDRLVFGQNLSPLQLADITFNVNGSLFAATEAQLGASTFYEVFPGAPVTVPEPGTYAMVLGGAALLVGLQRRRRNA